MAFNKMNKSSEMQRFDEDILRFLGEVSSLEEFGQQMMELQEESDGMISVPNLRRIFSRYGMEYLADALVDKLGVKKHKQVVRSLNMVDIMSLMIAIRDENSSSESYLDTLKLMFIQDDNDLSTYVETLRGFLQDEQFEDIKQGFADSISKSSEEDLLRFIGDIVSLGVERSRMDYVPFTIKFIRYFSEHINEQEMFLERYLVCNAYVSTGVLNELLMEFAELTPTDLLDNLVRHDINGSCVFGLNRIAEHLYGKIGKEVLRAYLDVATESGKQEIAMVIRDMVRRKMVAAGLAPVDEITVQDREDETTALKMYSDILSYEDDVRRRVTSDELSKYLGEYLDLDVAMMKEDITVNMRDIKGMEAWNFIEKTSVFRKMYGPLNAPGIDSLLDEDGTSIDIPYEPRLYHMRFNDVLYRLNQGDVDEELMEDPHLCHLRDWFTGYCQYSNDIILRREDAYRRPRVRGGWSGCYGSPVSILMEILQAYDVPIDKRRDVLDNMEEQFVRFFREVLGLEDNKLGYAYLAKNQVLLVSDTEAPRSAYDLDSPINRMPKIVIKYAVEHDEASQELNGTEMESFANRILEGILEDGDNPADLIRNGGPTRKFDKEVILKREDIIVFALTKIYFAYSS